MNKLNEQGQKHGPWEWYCHHQNGNLSFKGNFINGKAHGPWEEYLSNGKLRYKGNYVNYKRHGLWEWYYPNGELDEIEYYIR